MDTDSYIRITLVIGAAQGFFLATLLFTLKRGNKTANRLLGAIILLFTLMILPHTKTRQTEDLTGEYIVHMIFFLLPPLIFFYVKSLTGNLFHFALKNIVHFFPFAISLVFFFPLLIFNTHENTWRLAGKIITVMIAMQMVFYLYYSLNLLREYQENIKETYSYLEKINLNWLKFLLLGQIIIWPLFLLAELINLHPRNYTWIILSVFIYLLGYLSIRQPEILLGVLPGPYQKPNAVQKKYAKSALTAEISENYYNRLIRLMEEEKPYLKNNLALPDVARALSISNHHLSQVINEKTNLNFFEFINKYRIEYAKKLLLEKEKNYLSIAAISFEAGFNSVSSFNSVFKKMVKMTPSHFKNIHKSK